MRVPHEGPECRAMLGEKGCLGAAAQGSREGGGLEFWREFMMTNSERIVPEGHASSLISGPFRRGDMGGKPGTYVSAPPNFMHSGIGVVNLSPL